MMPKGWTGPISCLIAILCSNVMARYQYMETTGTSMMRYRDKHGEICCLGVES